ncbi:coatomer subunit alpha [Fragilaria crotonensis]|nr:coatomer subunit alpha [Fragilaria crotonensis]
MNRLRVEGLLAAFPKLVGHSKQHTFVETDSVRYVYQPLENQMYLLLITTKASNIVEDLGTLRLLAKVVPDVAGGLQESSINDHAFDLIFAFDEVLTAGGYKEEATLSSIRTNLLMDSHEEKVHLALKQSKEDAAKDEMRRQAKNIKERQLQQLRQNFVSGQGLGGGPIGGMQGFGGGGDPNQEACSKGLATTIRATSMSNNFKHQRLVYQSISRRRLSPRV